ncbi:MAG: aldo/keto reductase [Chloroflexi bacterium]|nr:aldo/keto reductase [Chloroflexota bacterium]
MEYRHLGKSGIRVSALSLGSWVTFHQQVDVDHAVEMMKTAFDAGVNFFDNAQAYAKGMSEEVMGAALKKLGWRRSSYLISSKYFWGINKGINEEDTLNRKFLLEAIDGSLQRLQLDHLDLIFCHRPDPETPVEETVWAMHNIIESGKAFYWGTSEWSAMEIVQAIEIAERHHLHKPLMEQPEYNLLHRERFEVEYSRLFKDYGYGATTWSPLASGFLSGKYLGGVPDGSRGTYVKYEGLQESIHDEEKKAKVIKLKNISDDLGVTLAQLSIAWILKNCNVSTVITGASRVEQVRENMKAMDVEEKLTPDVMEAIEKAVA